MASKLYILQMSYVDELCFLFKATYGADVGFLAQAAICDEKWNTFNQTTNQ